MNWICRWLAATMFGLGLPMLAHAAANVVGERHGAAHTLSAAVRDAAHRDTVRYTVWYPAAAGAREQPITIGPPGGALFDVGAAAADAPLARGKFPTLLLSHGNGGSARMMGWFGIAMARAGYLVIAVDHPGNNGMDTLTAAGGTLVWERTEDLKAALKAVQADKAIAPHLDAGRLGVAGFSAGGLTALSAAGARVDIDHYLAFCRANPGDGTCKAQRETPDQDIRAHLQAAATPELAPFMKQSTADHSIAGVRALFVMAPGGIQVLNPASLKTLQQPVSILLGKADPVAPPTTNGEAAAALLPHATIKELDKVGHYDFLSNCTDAGRAQTGPMCDHPVSQAITHATAIEQAKAFFAASLR